MTARIPTHLQLRAWVLEKMAPLRVGDQLPPEKELAQQFGVSVLTAHKVMADLQKDGLVQRTRGRGTFVAAKEGQVRSEGSSGRKGRVVMVYPHWFSNDIWEKADLAQQAALRSGLELVDYKVAAGTTYRQLLRFVRDTQAVKGVILIPPGGHLDSKELKTLDGLGVPVVLLVSSEYLSLAENVFSVARDNFKAGYRLAELLLTKGHREIGYVANEPPHLDGERFLAGLRKAMEDHGVPSRSLRMPQERTRVYENSMVAGHRFTAAMLRKDRPTALIYDSVPGAMGGMRAIHETQLRIPEDLSLVVNDDYNRFEQYLCPALTTIELERHEMVAKAFEIIRGGEKAQRTFSMDVRIVERESVAEIHPKEDR
jgi:GntR family transcriptional regulator, arabinose operon transcriptional repressor